MDAYSTDRWVHRSFKTIMALVDVKLKEMNNKKRRISSIACLFAMSWKWKDYWYASGEDLESIVSEYPEFAKSEKLTRDLRNDLYNGLNRLIWPSRAKKITDSYIETLVRTNLWKRNQ